MAINEQTVFKVVGNTEIIEQPKKRRWNLEDGVHTVRRFAGTKPAIEAEFNRLSSAGAAAGVDDLDEDIDGQAGRLVARVYEDSGLGVGGNTEEINAIWELYREKFLKPIETHTDFDGITGKRKRDIENFVRDPFQYPLKDPDELTGEAELSLAGYYSNGVLDYKSGNYVLRKSTTLSSRSEIKASHENVFRVVLLASINPPETLLGILNDLQKEDGSTGDWEWLKEPPQIIQVSKRKYRLQYEWTGYERIADIYGGSWSPSYS